MIILERVVILRNIPIFSSIPDFVLAAVAQISEAVEISAGETFIKEGEIGDCMYVIVEGDVRVHSDERTIIALGPGQTVGELAVLDPEPRSASASAIGNCFLFKIDKESFDLVMADRPEIARGVIRALSQRVREQGRLMTSQTGGNG